MSENGSIFDANNFLEKLSIFVRARPLMAARAYARAADKLRNEAGNYPDKRFALQALAHRLDVLSAESGTRTEMNFEPDEQVNVFADNLEDGIVTEWDALVANVAASKVDEEGNSRTELASAIMQQHYLNNQDRDIAEPVQIVPASVNNNTLLGSQALVQYGGISGSGSFTATTGVAGVVAAPAEAQVCRWEGRDAETMAVTVAVFIGAGSGATYPTASSGSSRYSYRPFARVLWGAGGHGQPNEVLLDVGRGCQFTVCANFLYVNVGMDPTSGSAAATYIPGAMVLGASMGFFTSARQAGVYRTMYADAVAAAGTKTIIIPRFAIAIQDLIAATPGNWTTAIQDVFGTTLATITARNVPLPNEAYQVLLTNGGGGTDNASLTFLLSL